MKEVAARGAYGKADERFRAPGMTRSDLVLAALATAEPGAGWSPVQVQKLFFLLERQASSALGGKRWSFTAYDYGPFDSAVYSEIETMAGDGLTIVNRPAGSMRTFRLTEAGHARGVEQLNALHPDVKTYVVSLAQWLRGLSFQQLVSAVYQAYPEMRENSIFRG